MIESRGAEMADVFSLVFFILLLAAGLLGLYFSVSIYRATKGAMKAWAYLSIYGMANSVLGLLGIVRNFSSDWFFQLVLILQSICIIVIFAFAILSATKFVKDLGLQQKIMTPRNVLGFSGILFLAVLLYNITNPLEIWPATLYGISVFTLCVMYLIISIPMGKLAIVTKKAPWILLTIGWFINAFLILSIITSSCCYVDDVLAGQPGPGCTNEMVFVNILPLECYPEISGLYQVGLLSITVGSVFIVASMGVFLYKLKRPDIKK